MKKWLALLLALAITLSLLPTALAAPKAEAEERDIWDVISEIEAKAAKRSQAKSVESLTATYKGSVDEIIEAVTSSSSYVPGTLERHGDFFFWVDEKGDPNGYSPSYRAKRHIGSIPGADPADFAATEIVNYSDKGGAPASINVAAFQPYIGIDSSFTAQYETRCNAIAQATGGIGTTYKTSNANVNNLGLALDTCGVVLFDSHGTTDYDGWNDYTSQANDSYLCLTTSTGITTADKASAQGEFGTYYHAFSLGGGDWAVDGTVITNHMTGTAPNSLIWMAICLGMATDGLEAPFHNHGAEVVYGYSQSVTFTGDYKYEGFFWPYMCQDHTVAESCAYMKTKSNCNWDPAYSSYSYSQAVANHVAFPIVSSSEDPYLGHGNVDVIQVPESTWTLFTQFDITAVSNNNDWGTVSVSGRQITASPKSGYEVVGYDVLSGTCSVTQNGNVFQVDAETDCTIRINFAARVPATVSFVVPEGVSVNNYSGYVGDTIPLPTPDGDPIADAYHYSFLGWVTAELAEDSQEMPNFQKAGTEFTVAAPQTTYYALYKYFVAEDGVTEGCFKLVTEAPASWTGDYVITYQGNRILDASGTITGSSIGGSSAAKYLENIGGTLSDGALYNIPDEYIYTVEPAGNGAYTLKMKKHDIYLALTSDSNALMTATSGANKKAQWTFSLDSLGIQIANANYTERTIRFNNANKGLFRCYKTGQQQIEIYSAGAGTTWFTTNPKNKTVCEEHSFGDWTVITEPTCTAPGLEKRVCTVCGYSETNPIEPLGHDYVAGAPVAPTCTEQGYTVYTCSRCQDSYQGDFTDALGHDYNAVVTEPTCTEGGFTTHTCSRCQDTFTDNETDALGHDFGDWTVTTEPTCTEPGVETRTCTRCDAFETRSVDAAGHAFGDWTVTTEPTCTEPGVESRSCANCDVVETRPVDVLGHDYQVTVEDPTCTEAGFTVHTCSRCGDSYQDAEVPALGHDYQDNVIAPTCTKPGYTVHTCSRCGDTYQDSEVSASGHIYGEPEWTWNEDYTAATAKFVCTVCGDEQVVDATIEEKITTEAMPHVAGEKTVTAKATFEGNEYSDEKTVEIEALPCPCAAFTDMPEYGTVEHDAIDWAFTHKPIQITSGTSTTTFGTEETVTRAQAMTFLWSMAGRPEPETTNNPFTDVKEGKYYTKAVLWAVEKGITKGTAADKFSPNKTCNRAEILGFLYNYMNKPEITIENPYSDVKESAWYRNAAVWAFQAGLEKGTDGKFAYKTNCTRAAIVTYLYRVETGKGLVD